MVDRKFDIKIRQNKKPPTGPLEAEVRVLTKFFQNLNITGCNVSPYGFLAPPFEGRPSVRPKAKSECVSTNGCQIKNYGRLQ